MSVATVKTQLAVLLSMAVAASAANAGVGDVLAVQNVQIIDLRNGRITKNGTLVIAGKKISAAGPGRTVRVPHGARVINAEGRYAIPGLWDMHVHLVHQASLGQFVANGVTGIRDMGGGVAEPTTGCESLSIEILLEWRKGIEAGALIGPRMFLSGPPVSGTGWPTSINLETISDVRKAVNRIKALGADLIKVYEKIPLDNYLELAKEAKAAGLPIAGHVPIETVGLIEAANSGHRSIEHIRDPLLMCFTKRRSELMQFFHEDNWSESDIAWGLGEFAKCRETIHAFKRKQTWLTPTLVVERAKVAVEEREYVETRKRHPMPESVRKALEDYSSKKLSQSPRERSSEHLWWKTQLLLADRMRRENVGFLAGTDSSCEGGIPGESLHEELQLMVGAGFSPLEALRTATVNPAEYFGHRNEFGSVEKGRAADLVLLNRNPLKNIENTKDIFAVIVDGRYLSNAELEKLKAAEGHF